MKIPENFNVTEPSENDLRFMALFYYELKYGVFRFFIPAWWRARWRN